MYKAIPPNYSKYWIILILGFTLACMIMLFVIQAEQQIDDLRPKVRQCCLQVTEDWCVECTRFADPADYGYYKAIYEGSK
jgi:hypothetical protein